MLEFLVCGGCGNEEAILVARSQSTHDSCAGNSAVCNWNEVCEFGFENGVEILGCADGDQTIAVGEICEDTDFVGVFKLHEY